MSKPETYIENSRLVTDFFGHWPDFYLSEILSLFLDRNYPLTPRLFMKIYVFTGSSKVDDNGDPKLKKHCILDIEFLTIHKSDLSGFNNQNVVKRVTFEKSSEKVTCYILPDNGLKGIIISEKVAIRKIRKIKENPREMLDRY